MKNLTVAELKAQFSDILNHVQQGESFGILYGKKNKPIAMIVPYKIIRQNKNRLIGQYDAKTKIQFAEDFVITEN